MKELKPIENKETYTDIIQTKILEYWFEVLFKPLFDILEEHDADIKLNAKTATFNLEKAIKRGSVIYADGQFIGIFNAKISRELRLLGAKFNSTKKTFALAFSAVPMALKLLIVKSNENTKAVFKDIDQILADIQQNINQPDTLIDFNEPIKYVVGDLDNQFLKKIINEKEIDVTIKPQLSQNIKKEVATNYTNNLNLYIKNWNAEAIPELRKKVQEITFDGYRRDKIQKLLQEQYGSAEKKAKFLARQENNLLVSQYRQQRFQEVGLNKYIWRTSGLMNVREDHKLLNGKIFSWDDPPIVDRATGRRGHPGEDFGCNCLAISIVE